MDKLSKSHRSWNMSRVRNKDTKPEILVRSLLHKSGYRFRIHRKDLPGKPDIVLPKYKTIVFVNGCFWHRHMNCTDATTPKTRTDFWVKKLTQNVERDKRTQKSLRKLGWNVLVVWECETNELGVLLSRLEHDIRGS